MGELRFRGAGTFFVLGSLGAAAFLTLVDFGGGFSPVTGSSTAGCSTSGSMGTIGSSVVAMENLLQRLGLRVGKLRELECRSLLCSPNIFCEFGVSPKEKNRGI